MQHEIAQVLAAATFFRGLSIDACRRLASLAHARALRKREVLFQENAPGEAVYFLDRGRVSLSKCDAGGGEIVIRTVTPGELFAEVVLFEQGRYPVTATAVAASRVLGFRRADFLDLLDEKGFRTEFIGMLMRKQRYLAGRIQYLTAFDVEERFFRFLREQHGEVLRVRPGLSKKDIAAAIGATPETFSRLVQRLRKRRQLTWEGGTLVLPAGFWERCGYG